VMTSPKLSDRFRKVVEIILAVGNYINSNAKGGTGFGFRLGNTLTNITGITTNEKTSLLSYLIDLCYQRDESIHEWTKDLSPCKFVKNLDFSITQGDLSKLNQEFERLHIKVLEIQKLDDFFVTPTFEKMKKDIDLLNNKAKSIEISFTNLLQEWGEANTQRMISTNEFFFPIASFMEAYDKELEKKEQQVKKAKAEEEKRNVEEVRRKSQAEKAAPMNLLPIFEDQAKPVTKSRLTRNVSNNALESSWNVTSQRTTARKIASRTKSEGRYNS